MKKATNNLAAQGGAPELPIMLVNSSQKELFPHLLTAVKGAVKNGEHVFLMHAYDDDSVAFADTIGKTFKKDQVFPVTATELSIPHQATQSARDLMQLFGYGRYLTAIVCLVPEHSFSNLSCNLGEIEEVATEILKAQGVKHKHV